jgi:glucose/arabinose dehydrogenase
MIYFDYSKAGTGSLTPYAVARGRLDGTALRDVQELYVSDPVTQGASRMSFAPDGTLYVTVSGAAGRIQNGPDPRKLDTAYGKVLRLPRRWDGAAGQSVRG